jgi:hypothetical protein
VGRKGASEGRSGLHSLTHPPTPLSFLSRPSQVAQLYLSRPYILEGRKWHLRMWLLVTRHRPLTAYLHRRAWGASGVRGWLLVGGCGFPPPPGVSWLSFTTQRRLEPLSNLPYSSQLFSPSNPFNPINP